MLYDDLGKLNEKEEEEILKKAVQEFVCKLEVLGFSLAKRATRPAGEIN